MQPSLQIPHLPVDLSSDLLDIRKALLSNGTPGKLQSQTWEAYKVDMGRVNVEFSIGFYDRTVCILFQVKEPEIRATYKKHLDPVFEDSCVEFFIGDGEGRYLNVECNPHGAVLAGIGTSRNDRTWLGERFFSHLRVWTAMDSVGPETHLEENTWEVLLGIPLDATGLVGMKQPLVGKPFFGNIYKCGDKLKAPHYISWAPIHTPSPDFHQRAYFGMFEFTEQATH